MAQPKKTAPYKYNQLEREFDQLRRKNRRRLVIAIILVMAAAAVLIQVLNQAKPSSETPTMASDGIASNEDHLLDDMLIEDDELSSEQTVGSGVLSASGGEASGAEAAASAMATRHVEKQPVVAPIQDDNPTPSISVNQKKLTEGKELNSAVEKSHTGKEAAKSPSTALSTSPKNQTIPPAASNQNNTKNNTSGNRSTTEVPIKKSDPVAPKNNDKTNSQQPEKNNKNTPTKLSPQDILNGKTTTPKNNNTKLTPQEILNGKTTSSSRSSVDTKKEISTQKVVIQVAALSSEAKANEVKKQLNQVGINAHFSKSDSGKMIRVRVGPYADRAQAQKALAIINQQGHQAIIVSQ